MWAERPNEFTNSVGMKFALIPAGEFMMGSPESLEELAEVFCGRSDPGSEWIKNEPQHTVRITKPFYLGVTEVTELQCEKVIGRSSICCCGDSEQPVVAMTWFDAVEFCNLLSEHEALPPYYDLADIERDADQAIDKATVTVLGGMGYRLPTEAEWEYACRAKSTTKFCCGDSVKELFDYAWCVTSTQCCSADPVEHLSPYTWIHKDDPFGPQAVGQKKPNRFGLYDMHGNVWEWCADWYDEDYYANSPTDDPTGPSTGWARVYRGGCWCDVAWFCRSVSRFRLDPSSQCAGLGFRVAQSPYCEKPTGSGRFLRRHKRPRIPAFPTPDNANAQ